MSSAVGAPTTDPSAKPTRPHSTIVPTSRLPAMAGELLALLGLGR